MGTLRRILTHTKSSENPKSGTAQKSKTNQKIGVSLGPALFAPSELTSPSRPCHQESQNDLAKAKEYMETNKKSGSSKEAELAKPEVTDDTNKWKKLQDKIESHSKVIIENAGSISEESKEKAAVFKAEGNKYFAQKKWSEAIDSYSKAIDINPNDATFYSNRSACFMQKDEPVMALEDGFYSRFLRPDWPKACFRISTAKLALEDYEDAAVWAWNGVTLDNKNQELKDLMQKCISKGKKSHKAKKAKESAEKKKKLTI